MSNLRLESIADVVRALAKLEFITRQDAAMRLALIDSGSPAVATTGIQHLYTVDNKAGCYRIEGE